MVVLLQMEAISNVNEAVLDMHDFFRELKLNAESQIEAYANERENVLKYIETGDLPEEAYKATVPLTGGPTRMQQLEAARRQLEEDQKYLKEQLAKQKDGREVSVLRRQLEELGEAHRIAQEELAQAQSKVLQAESMAHESQAHLQKVTDEFNRRRKSLGGGERRIVELEGMLDKMRGQVQDLQHELKKQEGEAVALIKNGSDELREMNQLLNREKDGREKAEALLKQQQKKMELIEQKDNKIQSYEDAMQRLQAELNGTADQNRVLRHELENANVALENLGEMERRLTTLSDALRTNDAKYNASRGWTELLRETLAAAVDQVGLGHPDLENETLEDLKLHLDRLRGAGEEKIDENGSSPASQLWQTSKSLPNHVRGVMETSMSLAKSGIERYKDLYKREQKRRKRIHNKLQELRGNIRVFVRVRPMNSMEKEENNGRAAVGCPDDMTLDMRADETQRGITNRGYEFDRVFDPREGQEMVYEEVSDLVESCMDGFNVCIFAYGQTGSGKTHTMEGTEQDPGIFYRAMEQLFDEQIKRGDSQRITVRASALEIYNEAVRDLLAPNGRDKKLEVKSDPTGGMFVQDLVVYGCQSMADYYLMLKTAKANRSTFATDMNEHSSRSHMIFSVYVETQDLVTGFKTRSKLHMVDLAGSERVNKSHARGDRLLEAQAINRSLSALGDVMMALHKRGKGVGHIPFRNSKLTFLLQDSLGGNSKVLMIAAVSPAMYNAQETQSTLVFAKRTAKVELGRAVKNVVDEGGANEEEGGGGGGPALSREPSSRLTSGRPAGSGLRSQFS